jgi:hypothetical protein
MADRVSPAESVRRKGSWSVEPDARLVKKPVVLQIEAIVAKCPKAI